MWHRAGRVLLLYIGFCRTSRYENSRQSTPWLGVRDYSADLCPPGLRKREYVYAEPRCSHLSLPSFLVRLWKLHGSLNWIWNANGQIVRIGRAAPDDLPAAIYPSDTKYDDSRRVPFLVLQDRFRRALQQPETLVLISGYSFGDDHLNELIFDAATRRERSEFLAFLYSDIPDALAERAEITPNLQIISRTEAIIGGIRANWKEPADPPT